MKAMGPLNAEASPPEPALPDPEARAFPDLVSMRDSGIPTRMQHTVEMQDVVRDSSRA